MNIKKALENLKQDMNDVNSIADTMYQSVFDKYFKEMRTWYTKFVDSSSGLSRIGQSWFESSSVIADCDLEVALTTLPLQLFSVSEELSKFKLNQEVVKLRIKELEAEAKASKIENPEIDEDKLIQSIYSSVVSRVESEISFSREFIMVMKKFWDARRATEQVNPVSEVNCELPEYDLQGKRYIK